MKNKRQEFIWIDLGACIYPTQHLAFICLTIPLEPLVIFKSVDILRQHRMIGIPVYNGINEGNAPSLRNADTSISNNFECCGDGTISLFTISKAAHVISSGLWLVLQIVSALRKFIAVCKEFVKAIEIASKFSIKPLSIPLGFSLVFIKRELNNSTSPGVHCCNCKLFTALLYSKSSSICFCSFNSTAALIDFQANRPNHLLISLFD